MSLFGDSGRRFLKESVSTLTCLAGDEIWKVRVQTEEKTSCTLFVLGFTGEAIGCQPGEEGSALLVRSDWMKYMDSATGATRGARCGLWDNLRCANEEEYVKGISKAWIQNVEQEGDVGTAKRLVAERYVMASVMPNRYLSRLTVIRLLIFASVSGEQMSHLQMAMQSAGIPVEGRSRAQSNDTVNLFLSEYVTSSLMSCFC